jgi:adenylate cyclase
VQLSEQILAQAIGRIDSRIQSQLEAAEDQSRLNELLLDRGALSPSRMDELGAYFLDALAAHEELSFLSFHLEATGGGCTVERTYDGRLFLRYLREQEGGQLELLDYVPRAGHLELVRREPNKKENEARPRPFYVAAKAAHHPIWTESFVFFGETGVLESPGVSYATPISLPDGSLLGVLTADFDMRAVSHFLSSLRILEHGVAFVVEYRADGTRRVIAHPTPEIPSRAVAAGGSEATSPEPSDGRVVSLLGVLPEALPRVDSAPAQVRFELEGTTYVGSFRTLQEAGLKWVVCVVAPEADILGAVWHNNRVTAGIVAVSVLGAALLALLLGTAIARPMIGLAELLGILLEVGVSQQRFVGVSHLGEEARRAGGQKARHEEVHALMPALRIDAPMEAVHDVGEVVLGRETNVGPLRARVAHRHARVGLEQVSHQDLAFAPGPGGELLRRERIAHAPVLARAPGGHEER